MNTEHDDTTLRALGTAMADGLRAYAGVVEGHPRLAAATRLVSHGTLDAYLTERDGDPRAVLTEFLSAATDVGATVSVDNREDCCKAVARFGPVRVTFSADAELMAGHEPRPRIDYAPLEVPRTEGGAAT